MKHVVAIFGYNNTRLYDVKKIQTILDRKKLGLLLCKEGISKTDHEVTPYCVDLKLEDVNELDRYAQIIENYCKKNQLKIAGILPFSDKGIILGSYLAEELDLLGDDYDSAIVGLDKFQFRKKELTTKTPKWYKKPAFQKINNETDLKKFVSKLNIPVFIKPRKEGNSRGCYLIKDSSYIASTIKKIKPYLKDGCIVEEYISNAREYSFDSVDGFSWITEKQTTKGLYRAEIQQIVPAPLNELQNERLLKAGEIIAELSGSKSGAVHNEIFLLPNNNTIAVEPNRRPAGMHIWDLASLAFENFNPFEQWVAWTLNEKVERSPLVFKQYAGIRMIPAIMDGAITNINQEAIDKLLENSHIREIKILKNISEVVSKEPEDNAGFIGYIIATHASAFMLNETLAKTAEKVSLLVNVAKLNEQKQEDEVTVLKVAAANEEIVHYDLAYLKPKIERWWNKLENQVYHDQNKQQLKKLLSENFQYSELSDLRKVGDYNTHVAVVMLSNLFDKDDPSLARLVHEALSDLSRLEDIQHPYENHKAIYLKSQGIKNQDWSHGANVINPHCDDLYEENDVDLLSLTTCRDHLKTPIPTSVFTAHEILQCLEDNEIKQLLSEKATFQSGMNVAILKQREQPLMTLKNHSFFMAMDFREDDKTGIRMQTSPEAMNILSKIKHHLTFDKAKKTNSKTGTFVILANRKVLHARQALGSFFVDKQLHEEKDSQRLLYRSKGPRGK